MSEKGERRYNAGTNGNGELYESLLNGGAEHGESTEARGGGLEGRPRAWGRSPRGFPDPRKTQGERVGRKIHSTIALRFEDRRSRKRDEIKGVP